MSKPLTESDHRKLLWTYIFGFIFSVLLTLIAYFLTVRQVFSVVIIVAVISVLAVAQLIVQLVFFLHLGNEPKPRWNVTVLLFAVLVVVIVGFGSLWIMNNLHYNMHPDGKSYDEYIQQDEGITQ